MQNPFFYGEEVSDQFFTNRKSEIYDLISDLSRGQNVILYSPRRYGKTSLIKKVLETLSLKGFLIIYVNLYAATSKRKFIEIYARAIAKATKGKFEKAIEQLKSLLPGLIPRITIKPTGLPDIEFDYGAKMKNLTPLLEDLYEAPQKFSRQKKKHAIVVFDEFQEILNLEDDEIERSMREYVQSQKNVTYVFLGSKRHLMRELFENKNRPFYKSGRMFPLEKISPENFSVFIKRNFLKCNTELPQNILEKILSITECHPYYTQMLCSILWDRNNGAAKITEKNVENALAEAISRESSNYENIWDGLSNKRKILLEAITLGGGKNIFSGDFISTYNIGNPSVIQKSIKALQSKEIIERENGNIIFSDIFFKQWILLKLAI